MGTASLELGRSKGRHFESFHFLVIFVKKWLSPRKNFQREIFFETNFFGLKYVLKHSESIPKKNFRNFFFRKFFFENFHFLTIFVKKLLSPRKRVKRLRLAGQARQRS